MPEPATPHRAAIIAAVLDRLEGIKRVNGYATDAGDTVLVGEIAIGPDDADCAIALVPNESGPLGERTIGKVASSLPLLIAALARVTSWQDYRNAWMRAEAVLGDIKQAIEIDDATYGGLIQKDLRWVSDVTLERTEGSDTLGIGTIYEAVYHRGWGAR